jgi:polysaccharide pyruvyl transferase WcaK-like protein
MAGGRPVVVLSPMAFAKPVNWPAPDRALHDRYVRETAKLLSALCKRGCFVVVACSSRGDDESVIPDIVENLDEETKKKIQGQIHFPRIESWRELISTLRDSDYLIASRLHGAIFGFISQTPVIAISFASKVDWVLEYLHQSEYRLDIRDFTAEDVLRVLDRIQAGRVAVVEQIETCRRQILASSSSTYQYDLLARLALDHSQSRNRN